MMMTLIDAIRDIKTKKIEQNEYYSNEVGAINPAYQEFEHGKACLLRENEKCIWALRKDLILAMGKKDTTKYGSIYESLFCERFKQKDLYSQKFIDYNKDEKNYSQFGHPSLLTLKDGSNNEAYRAGWVSQRETYIEILYWSGRFGDRRLPLFNKMCMEIYIAKKCIDVQGDFNVKFCDWYIDDDRPDINDQITYDFLDDKEYRYNNRHSTTYTPRYIKAICLLDKCGILLSEQILLKFKDNDELCKNVLKKNTQSILKNFLDATKSNDVCLEKLKVLYYFIMEEENKFPEFSKIIFSEIEDRIIKKNYFNDFYEKIVNYCGENKKKEINRNIIYRLLKIVNFDIKARNSKNKYKDIYKEFFKFIFLKGGDFLEKARPLLITVLKDELNRQCIISMLKKEMDIDILDVVDENSKCKINYKKLNKINYEKSALRKSLPKQDKTERNAANNNKNKNQLNDSNAKQGGNLSGDLRKAKKSNKILKNNSSNISDFDNGNKNKNEDDLVKPRQKKLDASTIKPNDKQERNSMDSNNQLKNNSKEVHPKEPSYKLIKKAVVSLDKNFYKKTAVYNSKTPAGFRTYDMSQLFHKSRKYHYLNRDNIKILYKNLNFLSHGLENIIIELINKMMGKYLAHKGWGIFTATSDESQQLFNVLKNNKNDIKTKAEKIICYMKEAENINGVYKFYNAGKAFYNIIYDTLLEEYSQEEGTGIRQEL